MTARPVKEHLAKHGGKWTAAGAIAIAATVGTVLITFGKTISQLEAQQNAVPEDPVATVSYVNNLVDERCPPVKKHKKAAHAPVPPVKREGLLRRAWHVLF